MGKLLAHQLKRHFSKNWFLIIAPILVNIFSFFSVFMNFSWAEVVFGLGFISIWILYCASAITIIVEDYQLFYGKSSLFYQSIPISSVHKTMARVLNYFILFFIYSILNGASLLSMLTIAASREVPSIMEFYNEIFVEISKLIAQVGWKSILFIIFLGLVYLINSISKVVFSITLGSEKKFRKFGLGGPVIIYAITSIIEMFLLVYIDRTGVFYGPAEIPDNLFSLIDAGLITLAIVGIVEIILFLAVTIIESKTRVSVS